MFSAVFKTVMVAKVTGRFDSYSLLPEKIAGLHSSSVFLLMKKESLLFIENSGIVIYEYS